MITITISFLEILKPDHISFQMQNVSLFLKVYLS